MNNYKNLAIWLKSIELSVDIYSILSTFPKNETHNLVDQIKRSVVSISCNIAEGAGRNSNKEFVHFLAISNGSSTELETLIIISRKLNYISEENYNKYLTEINNIQKMNRSLQNHLRKN